MSLIIGRTIFISSFIIVNSTVKFVCEMTLICEPPLILFVTFLMH